MNRTDEALMHLSIRLARRGRTSPNPHVGCVIMRDGEILARGYHHRAGEAHAEIDALRKLGYRAEGATVYVTLEPCNHHGRTPPCSDALIRAGVRRVVIGCEDRIAGHDKGAERLREAGIEVVMGTLRAECEALVADFYKLAFTGLPWVTLKAAVTLDGRTSTRLGDSRWITGEAARKHAHRLRDRHDAVLVGSGTVLADDPALTVRHVRGQDPIRVILDSDLRTPPTAALLRSGSRAPTWIFHGPDAELSRREALARAGAETIEVPRGGYGVSLRAVLATCGRRGVMGLLTEAGARLNGALLDEGLADAAAVFVAPRVLVDGAALPLALGQARERMDQAYRIASPQVSLHGEDVCIEGRLVPGEGA